MPYFLRYLCIFGDFCQFIIIFLLENGMILYNNVMLVSAALSEKGRIFYRGYMVYRGCYTFRLKHTPLLIGVLITRKGKENDGGQK